MQGAEPVRQRPRPAGARCADRQHQPVLRARVERGTFRRGEGDPAAGGARRIGQRVQRRSLRITGPGVVLADLRISRRTVRQHRHLLQRGSIRPGRETQRLPAAVPSARSRATSRDVRQHRLRRPGRLGPSGAGGQQRRERCEDDQCSETASRRAIPPPLNLGEHVFGSFRLTEILGLMVIPLLPSLCARLKPVPSTGQCG